MADLRKGGAKLQELRANVSRMFPIPRDPTRTCHHNSPQIGQAQMGLRILQSGIGILCKGPLLESKHVPQAAGPNAVKCTLLTSRGPSSSFASTGGRQWLPAGRLATRSLAIQSESCYPLATVRQIPQQTDGRASSAVCSLASGVWRVVRASGRKAIRNICEKWGRL